MSEKVIRGAIKYVVEREGSKTNEKFITPCPKSLWTVGSQACRDCHFFIDIDPNKHFVVCEASNIEYVYNDPDNYDEGVYDE